MWPEKEPQFFRPEGIPQRAAEVKEEKEINLEEKAKFIQEFIKKAIERETVLGIEKDEERKELLLKLTPRGLQEIFGEDLNLFYDKICDLETLKREAWGNIDEKEFLQFELERGDEMTPWRFKKARDEFGSYIAKIFGLIEKRINLEIKLRAPEQIIQTYKELDVKNLKNLPLKEKIKEWQDYFKLEKKRPIQFSGIKKLELKWEKILGEKGKELLKKGIEIIPQDFLSNNIKKIKYINAFPLSNPEEGNTGKTLMAYAPNTREVEIFKTLISQRIKMAENFPLYLAHEFGHSLDPRIVDQKDFSLQEQFKLIKEWEEIRDKEPPFSTYVKLINNPSKLRENYIKSKEDWATSVAYYLINPFFLKKISPQRYNFMDQFFKKKFPKFEEIKDEILKAVTEYEISVREAIKDKLRKVMKIEEEKLK